MNIYFSCSITGGRTEEAVYQALVDRLLALGHEVPTAHLSKSDVMRMESIAQPGEIFARDMNWLKNCDLVVAEVTSPSHGVGYEIAMALTMGKPVFCCYLKGRKVSMILTGNSSPNLILCAYESIEEAEAAMEDFLIRVSVKK
ncbi:MAG: nucleoside 2-deoxyribosyltransferase [Anaerolineaceae bacterium]